MFENAFRLQAIKRRRGRVTPEDRQLHYDFLSLPTTPPRQHESAAANLSFRRRERLAQLRARIEVKRLSTDSKDRITNHHDAICWRVRLDLRDENLPGITRHQSVAIHPAAQSGGSEVPIVPGILGDHITFGEVRLQSFLVVVG